MLFLFEKSKLVFQYQISVEVTGLKEDMRTAFSGVGPTGQPREMGDGELSVRRVLKKNSNSSNGMDGNFFCHGEMHID